MIWMASDFFICREMKVLDIRKKVCKISDTIYMVVL